jgi:hypothetical protein
MGRGGYFRGCVHLQLSLSLVVARRAELVVRLRPFLVLLMDCRIGIMVAKLIMQEKSRYFIYFISCGRDLLHGCPGSWMCDMNGGN